MKKMKNLNYDEKLNLFNDMITYFNSNHVDKLVVISDAEMNVVYEILKNKNFFVSRLAFYRFNEKAMTIPTSNVMSVNEEKNSDNYGVWYEAILNLGMIKDELLKGNFVFVYSPLELDYGDGDSVCFGVKILEPKSFLKMK